MEVDSITEAHVVQIQGLNVQPLTLEQAIIVQGYTGEGTVPMAVMLHDLDARGGRQTFTLTREAYREDFSRLMDLNGETAKYTELTSRIYDTLLDKMYNDPFAQWDNRVDVLIASHLNQSTKEAIRVSLALYHSAHIEFTERPGVTDQTWVVIHRRDPTEVAMDRAVGMVESYLCDRDGDKDLALVLQISIPERVEREFINRVEELTGAKQVKIGRERFKKHQTNVTLAWGSGDKKLPHDERGWEPN